MRPRDTVPQCGRHLLVLVGQHAVAGCVLVAAATLAEGQEPARTPTTVPEVIAGIDKAHQELLQYKGGISIQYRLEYAPNPDQKTFFVFKNGLDGLVNVRWPELRSRNEGVMSGIKVAVGDGFAEKSRHVVREGSFNLHTFTGVSRDDNVLGQITTYRSPSSANSAYYFRFQFFAEFDQMYNLDGSYKSDYWLPHSLQSDGYAVAGSEALAGTQCVVIRKEGLDTLWVAPGRSFIVCKREHSFGMNKSIRERTVNTDSKEISPGIWIPMRQVREQFVDGKPGVVLEKFTTHVASVQLGSVADQDVQVTLPETIRRVDDMVTGRIYHPNSDGRLDAAVKRARESTPISPRPRSRAAMTTIGLSSIAILLGFVAIRLHRGRPKPPPDGGASPTAPPAPAPADRNTA